MLKTRSLRFKIDDEGIPVKVRRGTESLSLSLEFPTVDVEATDAGEGPRDRGDPHVMVRFLDKNDNALAFELRMVDIRILGAILTAIAVDYDVTAVDPPGHTHAAD
jgi:hypothetical protein